jgi:Ribbon-helix-helix protein, copG family
MALLDGKPTRKRVCPVTVKLTQEELSELTAEAKRSGLSRSQWMRVALLARLRRQAPIERLKLPPKELQKADILLTEIVGIRLMLRNLLAPLAAGMEPMTKQRVEAILDEIKRLQPQVALDILNGETRK